MRPINLFPILDIPRHPLRPVHRTASAGNALARLLHGFLLIAALAACDADAASVLDGAELAAALESLPGIAPRLSITPAPRPCMERQPPGGTIVRATCRAHHPERTADLAQLAARASRAGDLPAARHALAVVDLVSDDERGIALDRAISALRHVARLSDHPAPVLGDLAAALIVRAERTQAPQDLLEAYETAHRALRHDPRNPAALYNRALALDRFGLVDETAAAWRAYLASDGRSGWAENARRRLAALESLAGPPAAPRDDAALDSYAAYAATDPQAARELGMHRLLGGWAEALQAADAARAADRLARAAALGQALARRPGGDHGLADAVAAIRGSRGPAAEALARAHGAYAAGQRALDTVDFEQAAPRFAEAVAAAEGSPVLQEWSRVYLATVQSVLTQDPRARDALARAAAGASPRYPALGARARRSLAHALGRGTRLEAALGEARASARLLAAAGERENESGALVVVAELHFLLGEADSGFAAQHRALDRIRSYRASARLHNLLASIAAHVAADGLQASAVRIFSEDVAVAIRSGEPVFMAEAWVRRARYGASADAALARVDLRRARALVDRVASTQGRAWLRADLAEAEGALLLAEDPDAATRALDSAAHYFAGRADLRELPPLVAGAEARLAAGDADGALRRLDAAIQRLEQRRDSIRMEPRRAAAFDAARGIVNRIVLLELARGDAAGALDYMDRARASLAPSGRGARDGTRIRPPAGETAVQYARIADTLLAWTLAGDRVDVTRTTIDTLQFERTLEALEEQLQRGAKEAEFRPALAQLYDWLVRPIRTRLPAGTALVMIADGEIAAVPFAALYDTDRGRYLVQDHVTSFAVSLRDAWRPRSPAAGGVLLIADPGFARGVHPLLERLPHARTEVDAIARDYARPWVLEGASATRSALDARLADAGVLHFAGHAVFDDQRPERSYLVLAPDARAGRDGRLTAGELAEMDLRHLRLVVLSACRTVRGGRGRAGGFTGLAGALLAAGVGGTVGSLWDADDRTTAALMAAFHGGYARGTDGPRALRTAQLSLLRSPDPALRSPAAWAGFRYVGR